MRHLLSSLLVTLSAFRNSALSQDKTPAAPGSAPIAARTQPPPPNTLQDGTQITIPKGTEVTAFVQGDMKLDMAKFAPAGTGAPATAASGLTVDANVPNCDIEVDGSFMGSTPSTLNLVPGKHEIVVKKVGYQDWSRSMMVGSAAVRLSAEMVTVK